jgi:prevent-host-death family protein
VTETPISGRPRENTMKTMDASKVRKSFSRVVDAVRDGGDELLITRYGRPVAALVRIERLSPEERKIVERQLSERAAVRRRTTE